MAEENRMLEEMQQTIQRGLVELKQNRKFQKQIDEYLSGTLNPPEAVKAVSLIDSFLRTNLASKTLIYHSICGSISFNLRMPSSDFDFFGVYVRDTFELIMNDDPNNYNNQKVLNSHDPDYVVYEVQTFCELVIKANPKVIEPLFQPKLYKAHCITSATQKEEVKNAENEHQNTEVEGRGGLEVKVEVEIEKYQPWEELSKIRSKLLTLTTIKQYYGFAKSQLMDISKGRGAARKKYYHAYRLFKEIQRMMNGETPKVWMDGEERDYLMSIRNEETPIASVVEVINDLDAKVTKFIDEQVLDNQFDHGRSENDLRRWLSDWIISIRRINFKRVETPSPLIITTDDNNINININHHHRLNEQNIFIYDKCVQLLRDHQLDDAKLICFFISGKHLHLNLPISQNEGEEDLDVIGIYVAKTDSILSLLPQKMRISTIASESRDTYSRGITLFEVGYAIQLIKGSNHRLIEAIFSSHPLNYYSEIWNYITDLKEYLMSEVMFAHYFGIGKSALPRPTNQPNNKREWKHFNKNAEQMNDIIFEDTPQNRKLLYHSLRVMNEAKRVWNHHPPAIYVDESIQSVLHPETDLMDALQRAFILRDELAEWQRSGKSSLPATIPTEILFALSSILTFVRSQF